MRRLIGVIITLITLIAAIVTIVIAAPTVCASLGGSCQIPWRPLARTTPTSAILVHQQIGAISYFDPDPDWGKIEAGAPAVGMAIINPDDGPGSGADPLYAAQVKASASAGVTILGYVHTGYAGTQDATRTLTFVEHEISEYYAWYPTINGIFVDEVPTDCAHATSYYAPLYVYIKAKSHAAVVALDPGTNAAECYMRVSDILVEYDDTYANYSVWRPSGWETKYPASRFWQIITGASQSQMTAALATARYWHVGWVYVTDSVAADPFAGLPTYWSAEVAAVAQT